MNEPICTYIFTKNIFTSDNILSQVQLTRLNSLDVAVVQRIRKKTIGYRLHIFIIHYNTVCKTILDTPSLWADMVNVKKSTYKEHDLNANLCRPKFLTDPV